MNVPWLLILTAAVVLARPVVALTWPRRWRASWRRLRPRGQQRSARISRRLRVRVLRADRYRCVAPHCRSMDNLQIDHIIPWAYGGRTAIWNLATLCGYHNRIKSSYFEHDGRVYYRAFPGSDDARTAAAIVVAERANRLSLLRWGRAWL